MGLRPYQVECVSKIEESFLEFSRVLVTLFTGAGKTIIFSEIANKYIKSGKKVLILAHREELLDQAADKMMKFHGVDFTLIKAGKEYDESKMFQIGSVQSLCKEDRLSKFDKDYYGFIIVDEAMQTSVKGVYAIGDVRVTPLRQVITAAADGAIAAVYAGRYIETLEPVSV